MNTILKHLPKTRIPMRWEDLSKLVLKVADQRGERITDLFTDRISQRTILKLFCRWMKRHYTGVKIFPCKEKPTTCLGMRYDTYEVPKHPKTLTDTIRLNVITDPWFDTNRRARQKRGWKAIALLLDIREFDGVELRKDYIRNHHRIICFT